MLSYAPFGKPGSTYRVGLEDMLFPDMFLEHMRSAGIAVPVFVTGNHVLDAAAKQSR
jgi:hypothetical protein